MTDSELLQLREDVTRMRRNLAQQLTETGDIVSALRQIDERYFEGRHFDGNNDDDDDDFFGDIRRSRVFLEHLQEELKHRGPAQATSEPTVQDSELEQRIAEMAEQLRILHEQTTAKDGEIADLTKQLATETQKQEEQIQSLRNQTSVEEANARERAGIELQLEDAKGQLGSVTWERDNLAEELAQLKEQLSAAQNEKEQAWAQTIALKSRLEHAQATIAELEDGKKVTESSVDDLKSSLAEAEEQNRSLSAYESEVATAKKELSAKEELIATHMAKIAEYEEALAAAKAHQAEQEQLQVVKDEQHANLERQLAKVSDQVDRGNLRQTEIEENLSVAIGERDRLRHELALARAKSESALAEQRKELEIKDKDRMQAKQSEIDSLRQRVEELEGDNKQLTRDLTSADNRRVTQGGEEVTSQLNDLRWELDNERTRHEEAAKSWRRHENEMRKLLTAARSAVAQAKAEREQKESVARSLIEDLQRQLREQQ